MKIHSPLKHLSGLCGATVLAGTAMASTDYGPAIWHATCNANWYTSGYGHKFCVVHDMEGYYGTCVSMMSSCSHTSSSVYYCINGLTDSSDNGAPPGEITQLVREGYYAWHACCWNQYSFGCEHEGFASNPAWYTEALYQSSGSLYRHWCDAYGIAKDRNHVVAHGEWQNANWRSYASSAFGIDPYCYVGGRQTQTHTDPGPYWDWNHYMNIITSSAPPSAGKRPFGSVQYNADGRIEVFGIGTDNSVIHSWQTTVNGGFSAWAEVYPGYKAKMVATERNADGRIEVFTVNLANGIDTAYQTAPNGGWSAWYPVNIGYQATNVVAGHNGAGQIELFTLNLAGGVDHCLQAVINGGFGAWYGLNPGYQAKGVAVGFNADGREEVFTINLGNGVDHCWQTAVNGGWSGWFGLNSGYQAKSVVACQNQDGRVEVFTINMANGVDTCSQLTPNGGWGGWGQINGGYAAQSVSAGSNADGRIQLFAVNLGNGVDSCAQSSPNGAFGGWFQVGSPQYFGVPRVVGGNNADGRLSIFARSASDATVSSCWQTAVNGGFSAVWGGMGGSLNPL